MAYPIKPGYNFKLERKKIAPHHEMPVADVYKDYYGIGYLVEGKRLLITPDKTLIITNNDLTFIHKDLIHRTTYVDDSNYDCISIKFRKAAAQRLIDTIGQDAFENMFQRICIHANTPSQKKILQICNMMMEEWNQYNSYSELILEGLLNQLFISCMRVVSDDIPEKLADDSNQDVLLCAIHYIESNFFYNPSLEEVANHVHISSSYLSRLFTQRLGNSFSRFLNIQKVNHAQRLLLNTSFSIVKIAFECGFPNSNYFCDIFKKFVGLSPLQYRKKYRQS